MKVITHTTRIILENLIQTAKNAHIGYLRATELIERKNPALAFAFRAKAETRKHHIQQLHIRVRDLGLDADEESSISGILYVGWQDVENLFMDSREETLLRGCLKGEEEALKAYCQTMEDRFDPATEWLLLKHRAQIESSISDLRQQLAA